MDDFLNFYTIFGMMFVVIGIPLAIFGVIRYLDFHKIQKNCTFRTFGMIMDIKQNEQGQMHTVVEYRTPKKVCRGEYGLPSKTIDFIKGQQVNVKFDPDNHDRFFLPDDMSHQRIYRLFICVGFGSFFTGVIFFIMNFLQLGL